VEVLRRNLNGRRNTIETAGREKDCGHVLFSKAVDSGLYYVVSSERKLQRKKKD
jgi:hypothetical protein